MKIYQNGKIGEIVHKWEVHIYDSDNQKIVNMQFDRMDDAKKWLNDYLGPGVHITK